MPTLLTDQRGRAITASNPLPVAFNAPGVAFSRWIGVSVPAAAGDQTVVGVVIPDGETWYITRLSVTAPAGVTIPITSVDGQETGLYVSPDSNSYFNTIDYFGAPLRGKESITLVTRNTTGAAANASFNMWGWKVLDTEE